MKLFQNFIERFSLTKRIAIFLLLTLITVFFLNRIPLLRFDNSHEIWFTEESPALKRMQDFERIFGNDDFIVLAFDAQYFFDEKYFLLLESLVHDIKKNVPYIRDVTWLGNAEYIETNDMDIIIDDFSKSEKYLNANKKERLTLALLEKDYREALITKEGTISAINIELSAYPKNAIEPHTEITLALRKVLENPKYNSINITAIGQPVFSHDYNVLSFEESAKFFGICLLVQCVVLFCLGKSIRAVIVPMLVVILSVIWTLGIIEILGFALNLFIILIPVLLICIGIGDSMHIIAIRNQHMEKGVHAKEALQKALRHACMPCLLTSLTTSAGFLGFCFTSLRPFQEMGIYASLACLIAYILSLGVVILFYGTEKTIYNKKQNMLQAFNLSDYILGRMYALTVSYPKSILSFFFILSLLSLYGYSFIQIESSTIKMLSEKTELRQSYDFIDENLGGSMSIEIILDTGKENGIKDMSFLQGLEKLQTKLDNIEYITKTNSILNLIKKMNQTLLTGAVIEHTQDNPESIQESDNYALPTNPDLIAQYILLYEMSDGKNLDKMISFDSGIARLNAKTKSLSTKEVRALSQSIEKNTQEIFSDSIQVSLAGNLDWVRSMTDLLAKGQQESFIIALTIVSVFMCLALRSLRLGLLSMLPNIFPVLISLGVMGFLGINMDMPLMSFSAIIIGVVVDDTIHFLFHYNKAFQASHSYEKALEITLKTAGRPMLYTTLIMISGFIWLVFSDLSGVSVFGGLACFAFSWALIAEYFFVPALLLVFRPLKLRPNSF